jgi:hypothetical protein
MRWPIRISFIFAAILSFCSSAFAQTSDYDRRPRTASVSGRVTVEGKPSPKVTVMVTEDHSGIIEARIASTGGREFVDPYFYKVTTDSEGRYQINGLAAGTYLIVPKAPAYVSESKSVGLDSSIKITLDEGEARENVSFALIRGGVITGRMTDEDGRPQVGRNVRLLELVGHDEWREIANWPVRPLETDDRGIYRIFGLRSGRYIAMAGGENDVLRYAITGKKTQVTYYPDVLKKEEATVIEIKEGREVTGVDIRLRNPVATFTVSGRVINSETGKPLPQVPVNCFPVENQEDESGNSVAYTITDHDGNFTASGLKPGKYEAKLASLSESFEYYSEGTYFEVHDGAVSGIEVVARRGATISGVVIVEEGVDTATQVNLSQATLNADVYQTYLQGHRSVGWLSSKIGADGGFRLAGTPPGKAQFRLGGNSSEPFYLMRIERDGVVVGNEMEVGPGEQVTNVRVIAGQGRGAIRGLLKIVGGTLPEGVNISVYATREPPQNGMGVSFNVDEKGRFLIKGLLTGEYTLGVSWSMKNYPPADQYPKIPPLPKQRVSVTNGAETQVTITYDLSRRE